MHFLLDNYYCVISFTYESFAKTFGNFPSAETSSNMTDEILRELLCLFDRQNRFEDRSRKEIIVDPSRLWIKHFERVYAAIY